jgi:hypothetical protein
MILPLRDWTNPGLYGTWKEVHHDVTQDFYLSCDFPVLGVSLNGSEFLAPNVEHGVIKTLENGKTLNLKISPCHNIYYLHTVVARTLEGTYGIHVKNETKEYSGNQRSELALLV